MATDRQIAANRKNAEKCTGPRTEAGKAISAQNAFKTGLDANSELIRFESREDYEALTTEYYAGYHPATPAQRFLVDTLIKSEWLSRRYMTIDAAIFERELNTTKSDSLGVVFLRSSQTFARVDRRINSAQRNFQQALKQLLQLQAAHQTDVATEALTPELVSFPTPVPPSPPPLISDPCESAPPPAIEDLSPPDADPSSSPPLPIPEAPGPGWPCHEAIEPGSQPGAHKTNASCVPQNPPRKSAI